MSGRPHSSNNNRTRIQSIPLAAESPSSVFSTNPTNQSINPHPSIHHRRSRCVKLFKQGKTQVRKTKTPCKSPTPTPTPPHPSPHQNHLTPGRSSSATARHLQLNRKRHTNKQESRSAWLYRSEISEQHGWCRLGCSMQTKGRLPSLPPPPRCGGGQREGTQTI